MQQNNSTQVQCESPFEKSSSIGSTPDLNGLPKCELHAHLNGCIPIGSTRSIVQDHLIPVPEGFEPERDLRITGPVNGLDEYFRPWRILKSLTVNQGALNRIVDAVASNLVRNRIVYAELRNSLTYIARLNGVSLTTALEWLLIAYDEAASAHGIDLRLIVSLRREEIDLGEGVLTAIRELTYRGRLVGIDLTGNEAIGVDGTASKLFRMAKDDFGLGITIHAGETGLPENVVWAIKECRADRIGHGLALASSPSALELAMKAGICVEVCLTSNLLTGYVKRLEDHPVLHFMKHGLPFVLCSDNPEIHCRHLSDEYQLFFEKFGRIDILESMYEHQCRYSFGRK